MHVSTAIQNLHNCEVLERVVWVVLIENSIGLPRHSGRNTCAHCHGSSLIKASPATLEINQQLVGGSREHLKFILVTTIFIIRIETNSLSPWIHDIRRFQSHLCHRAVDRNIPSDFTFA